MAKTAYPTQSTSHIGRIRHRRNGAKPAKWATNAATKSPTVANTVERGIAPGREVFESRPIAQQRHDGQHGRAHGARRRGYTPQVLIDRRLLVGMPGELCPDSATLAVLERFGADWYAVDLPAPGGQTI